MRLRDLERIAWQHVERTSNDPEARYRRRASFYRRHGFGSRWSAGFGASELAFTRWAIGRGVLNSLDHPTRPGSRFWRDTNALMCFHSELAALLFHHRVDVDAEGDAVGLEVRAWLAYLRKPSGETWYEAHNRSIFSAMMLYRDRALEEPLVEQRFINRMLCRLVYAEALASGALLGAVGQWLFSPDRYAVHAVLRISTLYPRTYPFPASDDGAAARALDRSALRFFLAHEEGEAVLAPLVERYLAPLVGGWLSAAEVLEDLAAGAQLYPRRAPGLDEAPSSVFSVDLPGLWARAT